MAIARGKWYSGPMSNIVKKPLTIDQATKPVAKQPTASDEAWHDQQTRKAIKEADAGDFATPEELKKIIRKYVPNE